MHGPPAPAKASSFPSTCGLRCKAPGVSRSAASGGAVQPHAEQAGPRQSPLKIEVLQKMPLFRRHRRQRGPTPEEGWEVLSLLAAVEALLPERQDLGAESVGDAADVEQLEFLQTVLFCL